MERIARVDCPNCSTTLEMEDSYFRELAGTKCRCPNCKQFIALPRICPQCQQECVANAAFCSACGADLSGKKPLRLQTPADTPPPSPSLNSRYQCPHCGNLLALGTRVCAVCRVDLRTGLPIGAKQSGTYDGIGRLAYWLLSLCVGLGISTLTPAIGIPMGLVLSSIAGIFIAAGRLQNIGMNTWLSLLALVPIANIVLGFWCFVYPEGYEESKELDSTAQVLIVLFITGIVLLVVGAIMVGVLTDAAVS